MAMLNAIVALCLFGGALAEVPAPGTCPKVETVPDFDIARYLGRWYEAEKYFTISEQGANCSPTDVSLNEEDNTINIINPYKDAFGIKKSSQLTARVPEATEPGKLKIRFSTIPGSFESDYLILGTDYHSYAVVYNCRSTKIGNSRRAWILTRDRNPSEEVIAKAIAVAERNHLRQLDFTTINHTGCEEL